MAVWFDGYTPALATAAMIAGANQQGHRITLNGQSVGGTYIDVAHGSTVAGPMWARAMRAVQDDLPDETSRHRSGTDPGPDPGRDPRRHRACRPVVRRERLAGRRASTSASVTGVRSDKPPGTVAETSPGAGESAPAARRWTSTRPAG